MTKKRLGPAEVDRTFRPHHMLEWAMATCVVLGMLLLFIFVRPQQPESLASADAAQAMLDFRENMPSASTANRIGQVTVGAAAADVLEVLGASAEDAEAAVDALRRTGLVDRKRMRPGTALTAYFDESTLQDDTSRLIAVSIKPNARHTLLATRQADDSFFVSVLTARLVTSHRRAAGRIETTLPAALVGAGGTPAHAAALAALFPDDPALSTGGQKGERYDAVFEVAEDERGNFIENGDLVFAAFNGVTSHGSWYRYTPGDSGRTEFFGSNGVAAHPFLTRFPIGRVAINSGFGQRYHPLTGQLHLHTGIDFRAPAGKPIQAAGDGIVTFAGFSEGYGRHIRIRHKRGYETLYAHMSGFAGLAAGATVNSGDVLGYVGDTGSATGAHLHYEIRRNGRYVNPMTLELPSGRNLASEPEEFAAFLRQKAMIDTLRGGTVSDMLTASNFLPVAQPTSP
ncbi:M23 family metallopeptidase [Hyphomonas sp.]|uniref:M23 family metallopeptidase n=1 Tax=Hyphomonas sp. TaxID=87 RepID=UPI0035654069